MSLLRLRRIFSISLAGLVGLEYGCGGALRGQPDEAGGGDQLEQVGAVEDVSVPASWSCISWNGRLSAGARTCRSPTIGSPGSPDSMTIEPVPLVIHAEP